MTETTRMFIKRKTKKKKAFKVYPKWKEIEEEPGLRKKKGKKARKHK